MALMAITWNGAVDSVLDQAHDDASDGGCYRGISQPEYQALQGRVAALSGSDRDLFNGAPAIWTADRDTNYAAVIESLKQNHSYEQFLRSQEGRVPVIERPASCDLIS